MTLTRTGTTVFATLRGDQWTYHDQPPQPRTRRRATPSPTTPPATRSVTAGTGAARSWPPHGAKLGVLVHALAVADRARTTGPTDSFCLSTPDTSPEAPNTGSHRRSHPSGLGNQVRALMPTPQAKLADAGPDYARAARPGSGGDDLTTLIARTLLPTPRARDGKGADPNPHGVDLNQAVALLPTLPAALLPTPRASDATKGSPHQHGSSGDLTLTSAVHLLPTPTAGDARSSAIQTVRDSGRPIPRGCVTLTDAARLLPTPSVADALGGHRTRSGTRSHELLLPGVAQSLAANAEPDITRRRHR